MVRLSLAQAAGGPRSRRWGAAGLLIALEGEGMIEAEGQGA